MQEFDSMPKNIASQQQTTKHFAARAVMAYRAGFPVELLSVTSSSEHPSGIVCDWKSQRDSFHYDEKLLSRAFAFVYVGSIVDQAIGDPISDELHKELVSDMSSSLDARQTAVDWGVAKAVKDTNPFAHTGYKLASRLLRMDQPLIESLARELTSQGTIEGDALKKWLDAMQAPSILMNWKQLRRTENNVDRNAFLRWRDVLTLTRVATVSVPIMAETCARRGAGFSRFLQLVPGEEESQTTGKLCVLHFFYKRSA